MMTELELLKRSGAERPVREVAPAVSAMRRAWRMPLAALIVTGALAAAGTQARAFDPADGVAASGAGAFQIATKADGDKREADPLRKLQAAALEGSAEAQWLLARKYAEGDGVPANQIKAFEYFRSLANQHADDSPLQASARYISNSFIRLADYYRSGLPDGGITRNVGVALNLLRHAATYFGDPEAQYRLGMMYRQGDDVTASDILAAKWLMLASRKGNVAAQAELGALLFTGGKGLRPQPRRGLMFLEMARRGADPVAQAWVIESHDRYFTSADPAVANVAIACADDWPSSGRCAR